MKNHTVTLTIITIIALLLLLLPFATATYGKSSLLDLIKRSSISKDTFKSVTEKEFRDAVRLYLAAPKSALQIDTAGTGAYSGKTYDSIIGTLEASFGLCRAGSVRACGTDVGECAAGIQTCNDAGEWSMCSGTGPDKEYCDSLDNDCDGQVDNACSGCRPGTTCPGPLAVTLDPPVTDAYLLTGQKITLAATATCNGPAGNSCGEGEIKLYAKQEDSPAANQNQQDIPSTGTPFTTPVSIQSCGTMAAGSACKRSWAVAATGTQGQKKYLYVEATQQQPFAPATSQKRLATITPPQCSDGLDNDADGRTDYPQDLGCVGSTDNNENSFGRVFASSAIYPGGLGGLAGADAKCQALAAQLGGSWKAWLSTNTVNAADRILDHAYVRMDGRTIANNKAELLSGAIQNAISLTETGATLASDSTTVWTGTSAAGTRAGASSIEGRCLDWTSGSGAYYGGTGSTQSASSLWTLGSPKGCGNAQRLYCFELPDIRPTPKITSVTPSVGGVSGGTPITIRGSGFIATPTVAIGGVQATGVVFTSSLELHATTPPGTGAANVKAVNPTGESDTLSAGFTYKVTSRVFVTSQGYAGSGLGGLAGADAKCQARANAASLGGKWKAWLSTSTVNAKDRIPDAVSMLLDGAIIANDKADLLDGSLQDSIHLNEYGQTQANPSWVWTGTASDGTSQGGNCNAWSGQGQTTGRRGGKDSADFRWTSWSTSADVACATFPSALYCFETPP